MDSIFWSLNPGLPSSVEVIEINGHTTETFPKVATRMAMIEQAAVDLLKRLGSQCPACQAPGYWVTARHPGLPCAACGRPFEWRAKWAAVWHEVRYCSDRCRRTGSAG